MHLQLCIIICNCWCDISITVDVSVLQGPVTITYANTTCILSSLCCSYDINCLSLNSLLYDWKLWDMFLSHHWIFHIPSSSWNVTISNICLNVVGTSACQASEEGKGREWFQSHSGLHPKTMPKTKKQKQLK